MALSKDRRKAIEKKVLDTFALLEPTKDNYTKLKDFFKSMNDNKFEDWLKALKRGDANIRMEAIPHKNLPKLDNIKKAADYLKLPLEDYVYFRHQKTGEKVRSKYKVPMGYFHVQRLQQIVRKKTSTGTDLSARSQITGQLVSDSAIGRVSDEELYALTTVDAEYIMKEFFGPRSDNVIKRQQMYQKISTDGFFNYDDLDSNINQQVTLNYLDTTILAAGLQSDLVSDTELRLK